MHFCYLDESGGEEVFPEAHEATPVMVIVAIIINKKHVRKLSRDFCELKGKHFPGKAKSSHWMDNLLTKIKGSDLRAKVRKSKSNRSAKNVFDFVDAVLGLFEKYDIKIIARIWVKEPHVPMNGRSTYTMSVQDIAKKFNKFCEKNKSHGMILCDSRVQKLDSQVAHSLFTMKNKTSGDDLKRLDGIPVFAHSQNEVGLQLADSMCSTLLFPIASRVLIPHGYKSKHAHKRFDVLHRRYGRILEKLQFSYETKSRTQYGIVVSDRYTGKSAQYLWRKPRE